MLVRNKGLWWSLGSTFHLTDGNMEVLKSHVTRMVIWQVRDQGRAVTQFSDPHPVADCFSSNGDATGFLSKQICYSILELLSLAH